ncbi:MAG: sigma-70 family RNA polymerase sigma factor [Planctomycetota bacterium]|nr:MAG: sigma-70 family RNA polymerase sigma factor [Planctomycetota bacterium]
MSAREPFHTTRWSLVLAARASDAPALEELCRAYWLPLYAYVRRSGFAAHEAEDVVQAFFARLLEKRDLDAVGPEKGRFRSFLLASLRHFVSNWRDHARAEKRGGGRVVALSQLALDFGGADERVAALAGDASDPERAFEQAWARELLCACVDALGREYKDSGRAAVFDELKDELQGAAGDGRVAAHAARLGLTEGAVKVAVHRLRARFRDKVRERVAATVARDADVDDELAALLRALAQ